MTEKEKLKPQRILKDQDIKNQEAIKMGEDFYNYHLRRIQKEPKEIASYFANDNCEFREKTGELNKEETQYCKCGKEKAYYGDTLKPEYIADCKIAKELTSKRYRETKKEGK